ncbi:hypothetical protein PPYR_04588 [Photinus pyralis]|uniref:Lipocalin/cytosolic fatty-acid binding domain-containing protein n=1 Tax=Photinus pyralis TaxID=7054 RepID=A0A1Y1MPR8_PHOPY|nr:fatty acid-binding protein-like [Photinus pyralis]KAB0802402.1 hypothetical protein PPYR_04588 [Photinus pyralis]
MVQIAGTYKLEKNENLAEYLTALGISEEKIKLASTPGSTVEITVEGNKYTFNSSVMFTTLILNEEVDEKVPSGITVKSKATLDGNKLCIESYFPDGRNGTRIFEFNEEGFIVTMTTSSLEAKRYFVRV